MEKQGITFNDELAVFLKMAAGGQSANTAQTYGQALAYLRRYLAETPSGPRPSPSPNLQPICCKNSRLGCSRNVINPAAILPPCPWPKRPDLCT